MSSYLFLLLVLACPLMMFWMMRGSHGHSGNAEGGHAQGHVNGHDQDSGASLEHLRREREHLDREIVEREKEEDTPTPVGGGWR